MIAKKIFRPELQLMRLALLILVLGAPAVMAQTTAFTYQGTLTYAGNPANGNYDLQFKLFNMPIAGGPFDAQQGATLVLNPVTASAGVFNVTLDFGATVFSGADRYLEIGVRPAGSAIAYTVLSPRQPINSTPYAIRSLNSTQLGGVDASQYVTTATVGNSFIKNDTALQSGANFNISGNGFVGGNVGIGTTTPQSKLAVQATGYGITQTGGAVTLGTFISTAVGGSAWFGTKSNHPLNFFTNDGSPQMTLDTSGNVGIGTDIPVAGFKLDTRGAAIFNPGGTGGGLISLHTPNSETGITINGNGTTRADLRFDGSTLKLVASSAGIPPKGNGIAISTAGDVTIGNYSGNIGKLNVAGGNGIGVSSTSDSPFSQAVRGINNTGSGVAGMSATGTGVFAQSTSGRALVIDGNATQNRAGNGVVKAMLMVAFNGNNPATIIRCYNGVTNSSSGNCGFSVTNYIDIDPEISSHATINFGFQVDDRFISVTPVENRHDARAHIWSYPNSTTVDVQAQANFYILVF